MDTFAPKLSVLIPTYNREVFVRKAIESVLYQEFSDFEIICCDNASSDTTFQVLQEYAQNDARVKVFQNSSNLGPVLNWKNCLEHACGEYIHWLWSDDWIEPNFYVDAFALLEKDKTQMLTTWNYRADNQEDENEKYLSWQFSHRRVPGVVAAKKILLGTYELPVSPAAYIIKRELVVENFYTVIPKISELLDPVKKAVGVDSLMIAGSALNLEFISVLQRPSVVFRQHDNISAQLTKNGTLVAMYVLSHTWFLANKSISLNMEDFMQGFRNIKNVFSKDFLSLQVFFMLFILFKKALTSSKSSLSYRSYPSNKAFFHKKVIAVLDEKTKQINISNKKIYLAPCNNVTQELYKEFETLHPKSIGFIDNYKKGENIIGSFQVKEYDSVFIYSPNYHKEISKSLPKGNKYLLLRQKNNIFTAQAYGWYSILMMKLFLLSQWVYGTLSYLKKISLFNIGSQIVYLSDSMKKSALIHKKIYITPRNDISQQIADELKKLDVVVSLVDEIPQHIEENSYLYLYEKEYEFKNEPFLQKFSNEHRFFLYYVPKIGFKSTHYSEWNLYSIKFIEFAKLVYLNFLYRTRLFFANIFKRPIHSNEKKIATLKNRHKNRRAFIVGNGPSLQIEDLNKLKNEITFAANKIYLAYDETSWRPTYYSVEDNLVMKEIYHNVRQLKDSTLILPMKDIREYEIIQNAIYYPLIPNTTSIPKFSKNLLSGVYPGHTVTYSMMQMAAYMGITEIYLIGVDFSYAVADGGADKGATIYHNNEKNHFHKDYRNVGDKWIMPNYEAQIRAYKSAASFCETNGIKIYNASRKTQLEVFERVDFDDLFEDSTI